MFVDNIVHNQQVQYDNIIAAAVLWHSIKIMIMLLH